MMQLRALVRRFFRRRKVRLEERPIDASDRRRAAPWNLIR
jgi:hypothetical protein